MGDFFSSFFGGGNDQASIDASKERDELAGIRQQLKDLAAGVPALTAKRAEDIKADYGSAKTEGLQNVREGLYGNRGLGSTSLESRYNTDLLTNLANQLEAALTNNELAGLQSQSGMLGQAAGIKMPTMPQEQASPFSNILSQFSSQIGTNLGKMDWSKMFKSGDGDLTSGSPTSISTSGNVPITYDNGNSAYNDYADNSDWMSSLFGQ